MTSAARAAALFAVLAIGASIPRFGQRENDASVLSDSDYYLDMAAVAAGERGAFNPEWSDPGYFGAHHYSRPLLPLLAGSLTRALPSLGARDAFSVVGVIAAWALALVLHLFLVRAAPALRHPWLPSALFLTGFPQVNWGYHILTDTLGFATAFAAAVAAWAMLQRDGRSPWVPGLVGLFLLQSLAFLARETAWMVPLAIGWLSIGRARRGERMGPALGVLATIVLAAVPHQLYLHAFGLRSIAIPFAPRNWLQPGYLLDFAVKSLVAFHVAWLVALVGWRKVGTPPMPELLVGWSLAALAYMAAGYAHNSLGGIGYPLRLTWALFPGVLFLVARAIQTVAPHRSRTAAVALVVLNAAIGLTGTLLDRGESGVTVPSLIERARPAGG